MDAGCVDKDDLGVPRGEYALNRSTGGLGLMRSDGQFLTNERVQQCGFAGVWTASYGDEA